MGLLLTDLRADFAVTRLLPATAASAPALAAAFDALADAGRATGSSRRRSPPPTGA